MKYIITRQFSFRRKTFLISSNSELVSIAKAASSDRYKDQFNVQLSNLSSQLTENDSCIVEPDENQLGNYLIYSIKHRTNEKKIFGQLFYQLINFNHYIYRIIIGHKLYEVRSLDLINRHLTIIDTFNSNISSNKDSITTLNRPEILFQLIDSFSKINDKYHVNIHDNEWPLGYLAITILLHLHESRLSLKKDTTDLWWTIDDTEKEITFELHIKSTGWIALAGGVKGADIVVGWVESSSKGRYAIRNSRPILDNATQDWFLLRGHEKDGWAAIQCKRLLSTCDSMNVPIKSGTNDLIFAYGLTDLDSNRPDMNIAYHDTHRNSRMIPLRSYVDPPSEDKFSRLDTFEFRLNNSAVPSTNTTYHCKIYKAPTGYPIKRHAIAHTILIDPKNVNLVHHLNLYESDPMTTLNGDRLSDGLCDEIADEIKFCSSNFATVWAVDSDAVRLDECATG
ncbi:unnamed protein product [Rotaria socialis]|uniref:DOMON domain-containing protein n=1 Tax=Rotaria socialis TaxID=392032 RepID=A0A818ZD28_9BILA|nr:unnamed protein product [Rotaria socialis]